jgi:hypothetical protein
MAVVEEISGVEETASDAKEISGTADEEIGGGAE